MLPPGPSHPRLWQTALFGREPLEFLERAWRAHGDVFSIRLANEGTWVVLASPDAAAQALRADHAAARAGEANAFLGPLLGAESVIVADGEDHLAKRRAAIAALGRVDAGPIVAAHLERWRDGETVRALPRLRALTLDVMLAATFGEGAAQRLRPLGRSLTGLLRFATRQSSLLGVALLGYGAAARNPVLVARRRAVLRHIRRASGGDRAQAEQLLTLLVAGHDTTASALAWAVDLLARDRPALARLEEDLVAGRRDHLDAVVRETLRLRPPVPLVSRRLAAPLSIAGWDLPAGVAVVPCALLIHRRPELFPNPARFRPERWLEAEPPAQAWLPFGGGPRRCLGAAFATAQMAAVLEQVALAFELRKPAFGAPVTGRRGHTLVPADDARVVVTRRSGRPAARPRAARAG